jgi:hypothetical protein
MIESCSPISLFIRVDFPTLGLPTIVTNPDFVFIELKFIENLKIVKFRKVLSRS